MTRPRDGILGEAVDDLYQASEGLLTFKAKRGVLQTSVWKVLRERYSGVTVAVAARAMTGWAVQSLPAGPSCLPHDLRFIKWIRKCLGHR